jgi:hypothetical protein
VQRPSTRFVPVKTDDQLDLQALHRVRSHLISERTAVINQIRSLPVGARDSGPRRASLLRRQLPEILAKRVDVLSPRIIRIVEDLGGDWRRLDKRIDCVTEEIEQLAHGTESCRQLMTVPGIGPNHCECDGGGHWQWRFKRSPTGTIFIWSSAMVTGSGLSSTAMVKRSAAKVWAQRRSYRPRTLVAPGKSL